MNSGIIPISNLNLALSVALVLLVGGISALLRLGLLKSLAWGTVRTFVQLSIMGYALVWIFSLDSLPVVAGIMVVMCFVASRTVVKRTPNVIKYPTILAFISLVASTFLVTFFVTCVVISAERWYAAEIVIPVAGMALGKLDERTSIGDRPAVCRG